MSARAIRARVQREVAALLESQGYPHVPTTDRKARSRDLDAPLVAVVTPVIEGHRYGGASLTAQVTIVAEPVQAFLVRHVAESALARDLREGETMDHFLEFTTFGTLLTQGKNRDQQWQVEDEAAVDGVVAEFGSVVGGPVRAWVEERHTVDGLLDQQLARSVTSMLSGRACAVLALQTGRPETAGSLITKMASAAGLRPDDHQRLSAFQATLVEHFPDYRPVEIPGAAPEGKFA